MPAPDVGASRRGETGFFVEVQPLERRVLMIGPMALKAKRRDGASRRRAVTGRDRDSSQLEEVKHMAHQYRCEKCGHVADRPGSCCGQPMKEIS